MANEKRLIDANALTDAFRSYMVERYDKEKCVSEENCKTCKNSCLWRKIVSAAPTVDAIPAAHSKWVCVNEDENVWMCDGIEGCGGEMIILEKTPLENGFHFCPYCGADMRDGDGDG